MTQVRPATLEDAFDLAPRLRKADVVELTACGHQDMLIVLAESIAISTEAWAFEDDLGVVQAVGGLAAFGSIGAPWLLGSDEMLRHRKALLNLPRLSVRKWASQFPLLMNYVHHENRAAILWLRRLGFEIHPKVNYKKGVFHPFSLRSIPNV